MIELVNINKWYNHQILKNINIKLEENNIYVLKGISGCGKTTLLNIISGIDLEYTGKYLFNNEDLSQLSKKEKRKIFSNVAYIFQNSLLIKDLTIYENLLLIKNNKQYINELSIKFHIQQLLNKFPNQLSGGERQKVSIIRALLIEPKIIIADEPTASLDKKSALEFCKMINLIRNENKIVIIATHDNIFDDVANIIFNINYGTISVTKSNANKSVNQEKKHSIMNIHDNGHLKFDFIYILKKFTRTYKKNTIVSLTIIILNILLCLALKINFNGLYLKYISNNYPINTVIISEKIYNAIKNESNIVLYNNYNFSENGIHYLTLLPKESSLLNNKMYIYDGTFPNNDSEVLVNYQYFAKFYNYNKLKGNEIVKIMGKNYKIVGIITDNELLLEDIYSTNSYYSKNNEPQVFIPYDSIMKISTCVPSKSVMVKIDDLYDNKKLYSKIENYDLSFYNVWDKKISDNIENFNLFSNLFFIILIVIFIISFIFIINQNILSFYYKKRELGYLQLFGINKTRVKKLFLLEYIFKYIISLILAVLSYYIIVILIYIAFNINLFIQLSYLLLTLGIIIIYCYMIIIIPLNIYISKSIKNLIDK